MLNRLNVTDLPEAVPGLYDIADDEATRTLTVTFVQELASPPIPPGSIGLEDGSSEP